MGRNVLVILGSATLVALGIYFLVRVPYVTEDELVPVWFADPERKDHGRICLGYNPELRNFSAPMLCPQGYAAYAEGNPGGAHTDGPAQHVPLNAYCCPLPFDDILTDEHAYNVIERCPDNYVATGGQPVCSDRCGMRCTRINTDKYQLGPETQAIYWKHRGGGAVAGRGTARALFHDQIPLAIRAGIGRDFHYYWSGDGCIGLPFGSLATRKNKKTCDGYYHRQLQYKDGTPVPMFPECDSLDIFDPEASCVKGGEPSTIPLRTH